MLREKIWSVLGGEDGPVHVEVQIQGEFLTLLPQVGVLQHL